MCNAYIYIYIYRERERDLPLPVMKWILHHIFVCPCCNGTALLGTALLGRRGSFTIWSNRSASPPPALHSAKGGVVETRCSRLRF